LKIGRIRVDGRNVWIEIAGGHGLELDGPPWLGGQRTGQSLELPDGESNARWLAPVTPSKILCVGRNYRKHAEELGNEVPEEPLLFYKPPSSIIGPGENIELPPPDISTRIEHEAEIAVVIGRSLRGASIEQALAAIFGFTLLADITARDLQKKDRQWWRAKGMDTFCPVGPAVVTDLPPQNLAISARVNGELRQQGNTADMIFPVGLVLSHISRAMTLAPGDLVATGTPEGVGPLSAGDELAIESPEIGKLVVGVIPSQSRPT